MQGIVAGPDGNLYFAEASADRIGQLVPAAPLAATGVNVNATEGMQFSGMVATFTDADATATATAFTVAINWGDGTPVDTTSGMITLANGIFSVTGTHTYAEEGQYTITVTVQETNPMTSVAGSPATGFSTAIVADAPLTATAVPVVVSQGVVANNVTVATFTDVAGAAALTNYSATINWGDGSSATVGTITQAAGTFSVSGTHTFSAPGRFQISVSILDRGGSTAMASASAVVGNLNERFVAQVYEDLLNRPVDPAGLAFWTGLLGQGTTQYAVVSAIEESSEYQTVQVQGIYTLLLHRQADPAGLGMYVAFLEAGGTVEQVAAAIAGSTEYFQTRGGGTNNGFLSALYQDVLNRPIDASGQASLTQLLANGASHTQVVSILLASTEYQQDLVQSFYQRFLHRAADPGGLATYTGALQQGMRNEAVIAALLSSMEFLGLL